MSERKIKTYTSDAIDVTYDVKRCIHAKECVRGLPAVFDVEKRPWVQPGEADADEVARVVMRCPTGALEFARKDGGSEEPTPDGVTTIGVEQDGPLYLRGDITVANAAGETLFSGTRVALCRCGQSTDKPFCDGSHSEVDFTAPGTLAAQRESEEWGGDHALDVKSAENGPLLLYGDFEVRSMYGQTVFTGSKAAMCRCGGSSAKPFCDGTHNEIEFEAE